MSERQPAESPGFWHNDRSRLSTAATFHMKPMTATERLEDLLAYRLPQSGKALSSIVLSRTDAEQLLREIYELRLKLEAAKKP